MVLYTPLEQFVGNVVYVATTAIHSCLYSGTPLDTFTLFADYNIYCFGNGGGFHTHGTFQDWQAAGHDAHGIIADPLLVNVNPGFEDLHITAQSPARDFVPLLTVSQDNEGDPRPMGIRRDAGADEFRTPAMGVLYGAAPVVPAGNVVLGNVPFAGAPYQFSIRNSGLGPLDLTGLPPVLLTPGTNCAPATVVLIQPALVVIPPQGVGTFTVFVQAAVPGVLDFQISIASSDTASNPFTFTVGGTGLPPPPPNLPAQANAPGSALSGPLNGPFTLTLAPGAALVNAGIRLADPEADLITVSAITPVTSAPLGITAPAIPAPGQPLMLAWTGTASPLNPPGAYSWTLNFADAVNGAPVQCTVTITITDPPPQHAISGAAGGNGLAATPYTASFTLGQGPANTIGLASVTDANTTQGVIIVSITPHAANPAAAFGITLAANVLTAAPLVLLDVPELGTYNYTVTVTDGTSNVDIHLRLTVTPPQQLAITTATQLPDGRVGATYMQAISATGAWGAITWQAFGTLPDGLTLGTSGDLSGTPTAEGQWAFLIRGTDSAGQVDNRQFQITITTAPPTPPDGKDESNGCTAGAGLAASPLSLVMLLPAVLRCLGRGRRKKV